jgi:hypothetical protein
MYLLQNWQICDFLVIKLLQLQQWVSQGARLTQLPMNRLPKTESA